MRILILAIICGLMLAAPIARALPVPSQGLDLDQDVPVHSGGARVEWDKPPVDDGTGINADDVGSAVFYGAVLIDLILFLAGNENAGFLALMVMMAG